MKGFAWLASRRNEQMQAALAGTQFTLAAGPPWWAIIPREQWPAGLQEQRAADLLADLEQDAGKLAECGISASLSGAGGGGRAEAGDSEARSFRAWDSQHGDRRTELVCIGRALDHEAARCALEACLLTPEEMAKGEMSWLLLPDPWPGSYADPDAGRQAGRLFDGVLVALLVLVGAVSYAWLPK